MRTRKEDYIKEIRRMAEEIRSVERLKKIYSFTNRVYLYDREERAILQSPSGQAKENVPEEPEKRKAF